MTNEEAMNPTIEEAIERLKSMVYTDDMSPSTLRAIAVNTMAIKALEKQVPKKPFKESLSDRLCPICLSYLSYDALNDEITTAPNFCKNCGQAIDWSDV